MTTQSGISASSALLSAWADAIGSPNVRLLKIAIEAERLVLADSINVQSSFEDDFGLIAVEDSVPAYFLYRLEETPTSQWVFYSYVPDHAPVRSKMLYASSRATLVKNLGDSRVATSIFATTAADLNHASYLSHLKHLSSAAPLTTREQEIADIRTAERSASHDAFEGAQAGQAVWSGAVGLAWSEEAKEVLEKFAVGEVEGEVVRLEVDTKKEEVVAAEPQPSSLELPISTPSYTFYRHARGIVFIYSCPPSSPVKSRLLYSSSAGGVINTAKSLGVVVAKKIETSSPEEVDLAFVDAEFGPAATDSTGAAGETSTPAGGAPLPASEKAFSKPSRPGRKR